MGGEGLRDFLKSQAEGDLLPLKAQFDASQRFGVSVAGVEASALACGLLPARYRRNRETLSIENQLQLFRSRVVMVGCGGLGGYLVEEAARLGVGTLVLVDPDVFEEHNLNRQLLSSLDSLGRPKVEVGRERVGRINPAVTVIAHRVALSQENAREILLGSSAVLDGLDSVGARRELSRACRELPVPLIHGAIAGWYGQVAVQMVGQDVSSLMALSSTQDKGAETTLGNPSFTPAAIASLQAAEMVKVLLGRGTALSGRALLVNLLDMEFEKIGL